MKRRNNLSALGFSLPLTLLCSGGALLHAQSVASITAVVTDPTKATLSGAQVVLIETETNRKLTRQTNRSGLASFSALRPGEYIIEIKDAGFSDFRANIKLVTGDDRQISAVLPVGSSDSQVTVNASDNAALSTDASVQTVITQEQVKDLPLNGRTFQNLIALTPGVARSSGAGLFSFNGQRDNSNYVTVDGVAANTGISQSQNAALGQYGAGQAPSLSAATTTSSLLSLDALEEIKIQSSTYSAEYGRSAGGQIQLTSRGGTNRYHASAFDYFRNDYFDAWNPYTKFNNLVNHTSLTKPPLRLNDFGGTFGGPVRIPFLYNGRNRSFFFASYEGLRVKAPGSALFETTSDATRAGTSASTTPNSTVLAYLNLSPRQGTNTLGSPLTDQYGVAAYARSYSNSRNTDATSVRFDQTLGSHVSVFARAAYAPSSSSTRGSTFIGELDTVHQYNYTFTAGSSQTFGSHVVNEFRANYTRAGGNNVSTLDSFGGATAPTDAMYAQMFPSQYGASVLNSSFSFGEYAVDSFAYQVGTNQENTLRQVNLIDGVTWLKGHHQLKAGVDWRYLFPTASPTAYSQTVAYYAPTSLATGISTIDIANSRDQVTVHQHDVAMYLEDTWHVTPNLTVNAGLRWDIDPAPYGVDGQSLFVVSNLTSLATATLAPAGTSLYATRYNQFQPRVGVAYVANHTPNKETLIRAGFGTYYVPASDTGLQATNFYPHQRAALNQGVQWYTAPPTPVTVTGNPPYTNQNILAYDPGFVTPRTFEWNVSVQQNLGARQTFTLGYVASAGRNLSRLSSYSGSSYSSRFLNLNEYFPADTADYESLQASYVQQMKFGLALQANYTWSKALDTQSNDTVSAVLLSYIPLDGERGRSSFDQRNAANIALDWNLPHLRQGGALVGAVVNGWGVDTIFQAHSGNPLTPTFTRTVLPQGGTTLRPDIVPGVPLYLYSSSYFGGRRLNPAAFSANFLTTSTRLQGNEARGLLTDRGFDELDFTVRREFNIHDNLTLQYRCEVYNLANQTSYAPPSLSLGNYVVGSATGLTPSTTFGGVTNTYNNTSTAGAGATFGVGGPRSLQMALRLAF